jgi:hypothetical protein
VWQILVHSEGDFMNRIPLIFLAVILGTSALADDGKRAANNACGKISSSFTRRDCVAEVAKASYFDVDAANRCGQMMNGFNLLDCIKAIANKHYSSGAVSACNMISDLRVIECLDGADTQGSVAPQPSAPQPQAPQKTGPSIQPSSDDGITMSYGEFSIFGSDSKTFAVGNQPVSEIKIATGGAGISVVSVVLQLADGTFKRLRDLEVSLLASAETSLTVDPALEVKQIVVTAKPYNVYGVYSLYLSRQ